MLGLEIFALCEISKYLHQNDLHKNKFVYVNCYCKYCKEVICLFYFYSDFHGATIFACNNSSTLHLLSGREENIRNDCESCKVN